MLMINLKTTGNYPPVMQNKSKQTAVLKNTQHEIYIPQNQGVNLSPYCSRVKMNNKHTNTTEICNCSQKNNFVSPSKSKINAIGVVICQVPDEFNIPDILIGISDLIHIPVHCIQLKNIYISLNMLIPLIGYLKCFQR